MVRLQPPDTFTIGSFEACITASSTTFRSLGHSAWPVKTRRMHLYAIVLSFRDVDPGTLNCSDADFVACYPFTMRRGVPTAMSHGMWLNVP